MLGILTAGCATGISTRARSLVGYVGSFSTLQTNPHAYRGEVALVGGKILEVQGSESFSELTVLQLPLGTGDRPRDVDRSEGRFLVRANRLLDPSVYQPGRFVTVVGRVAGSEVRPIGSLEYRYPVFEAIEIKLWSPTVGSYPNVFFGVGVGARF
jgi:outer membrane lipoprotein